MTTKSEHICTCNRCETRQKLESEYTIAPGWTSIQAVVEARTPTWSGGSQTRVDIDLCPTCSPGALEHIKKLTEPAPAPSDEGGE